jgi:hypothetical protein
MVQSESECCCPSSCDRWAFPYLSIRHSSVLVLDLACAVSFTADTTRPGLTYCAFPDVFANMEIERADVLLSSKRISLSCSFTDLPLFMGFYMACSGIWTSSKVREFGTSFCFAQSCTRPGRWSLAILPYYHCHHCPVSLLC